MLILNKREQRDPGVFYHPGLGIPGYCMLGTAGKTSHSTIYVYSLPSTNAEPHFPQRVIFHRGIRCGLKNNTLYC